MTKKQAATYEAEAFVRRAIAHISKKPSEKAIKKAAQKVVRALPRKEYREQA